MASSMAEISTDDIGLAAEMRRDDEMDMRLELDIDDCDERAEAAEDEGEMDRGVEMSELLVVLWAYGDAIACAKSGRGEKDKKDRKGRRARKRRV